MECRDHREAAILGGLVGSLVTHRKLDLNYARHHAVAALEWATREMLDDTDHALAIDSHDAPLDDGESWHGRRKARVRHHVPSLKKPSEAEMRAMTQRLMIAYRGPEEGAAA